MKDTLLRRVAAVSAALAMIATVGLLAPPAQAQPRIEVPTPRKVVKGDPYKHIGAKKAARLKAGQSINRHATGPKRKVLDYKLAKKYDRGQVTVRRQFAASWLWYGKRVKNISKKELKIVRSYVKRYFGNRQSGRVGLTAKSANYRAWTCQGRGGFVSLGGGAWNGYFNSCSTAIMILELRVLGILIGLVSINLGPYAPVGIIAAAFVEIGASGIELLRDFSSESAVYIIRRMIGPATARQQVLAMLPQ